MKHLKKIKLSSIYDVGYLKPIQKVICLGNRISIFDLTNQERTYIKPPTSNINSVLFNQDGSRFALKSTSGRIFIINTANYEILFDLKNQKEEEGCGLQNSPCGKYFIYGTWAGRTIVRSWNDGSIHKDLFLPNSMIRNVTSATDGIYLFDVGLKCLPHEKFLKDSNFSIHRWPFDNSLHSKCIVLKNCRTKKTIISPDGKLIAFVGYRQSDNADICKIVNTDNTETAFEVELPKLINVSWSECGCYIAISTHDHLMVFETLNFNLIKKVSFPDSYIFYLPEDKSFLIAGGPNGAIFMPWNEFLSDKFLGIPFPHWWGKYA